MAIRLYWWQEKRESGLENYGDLMSKYLVEKISGKRVKNVSHPSKRVYKYILKHYLVIGSIISAAQPKSIVWGSGIIKADDTIRNAEFAAVRGPKTRQAILDKGFKCPENYGDPALLMPKHYDPKIKKKFKIGIIPHYVDFESVNKQFKDNKEVKIINLLTTDVEGTTNEILECEQTISSSLHGVIVSHSYNIPSLWVKFSDRLSGDNIKFYDYFESVNLSFKEEINVKPSELTTEKVNAFFIDFKEVVLPKKSKIRDLQTSLMQSCPFI